MGLILGGKDKGEMGKSNWEFGMVSFYTSYGFQNPVSCISECYIFLK